MSHALAGGATGPETVTAFLALLSTHFDHTNTGARYTKLVKIGVSNVTPFYELSRESRWVVSVASGTECALDSRMEVVLEVFQMAANEQYPSVMPTLYPGVLATVPRPCGWLFTFLRAIRHLPSTANNTCLRLLLRRVGDYPPRRGRDPPVAIAARVGHLFSRLRDRRDRAKIHL